MKSPEQIAYEMCGEKVSAIYVDIVRAIRAERNASVCRCLETGKCVCSLMATERNAPGRRELEHIPGCYDAYGDCTCKEMYDALYQQCFDENGKLRATRQEINQELITILNFIYNDGKGREVFPPSELFDYVENLLTRAKTAGGD